MRSSVALLGFALAGCNLDAFGLADSGSETGGSESSTTRGPESETTATSDPSVGTEQASGSSSGPPADEGSSSTSGSSSPASTSSDGTSTDDDGSSTGDPPASLCPPPTPELAACYDFLDVGAGTLWDLSGNGNDAPALGVGVVPGPFGDAATFDDGSEIAVPDSPSLDIAGDLTLEAWIMVDALPPAERIGVLDNEGQYAITIQTDDQYRCAMGGVSVFVGPVVLGEWSHVACVFDGAALRFYLNGVELDMTAASGPINTADGDPMSIGDTSPAFTEPFLGAIGGLRIWSTALSPAELCDAAGPLCPG